MRSLILTTFTLILVFLPTLPPTAGAAPVFYDSTSGPGAGDQFGASVDGNGDFNGDGFTDLLVGANATQINGPTSGTVYLYLGGATTDWTADLDYSGSSGDFLGGSVAWIGDINNDGYDDFAAGAAFNSDVAARAGKVFVFLGGDPFDNVPDLTLLGANASDYFGIEVAGIGDFNGDNIDDFAVGAYRFDPPGLDDAGAVYIYHGGATPDNVADQVIHGKTAGERFGYAIAGDLDLDGDFAADLLAGAYSYDTPTELNLGRVYHFSGGSDADSTADLIFTGKETFSYFGYDIDLITDTNGDNYSDLLVGAYAVNIGPALDAGRIYLHYGGPSVDTTADYSYDLGNASDDNFGYSVSALSDLSADGIADFAAGAPLADPTQVDAGEVVAFDYSGSTHQPLDTLDGVQIAEEFGHAIADLGRFTTGWRLFAVGAWGHDTYRGKVYLYGVEVDETGGGCGDADGNGTISITDAVYLINYIFGGGPPPDTLEAGDPDCNGQISITDAVYIINYIFGGGPAPCAFCP